MDIPEREDERYTRDEYIVKYFNEGYNYMEITTFLRDRYGIGLSVRHLLRILAEYGLKRKGLTEHSLEEICTHIILELDGSGSCLGYKRLWQRLKHKYRLNVKRNTVLEVLRVADPEGISRRARNKLKRRRYAVPGPNFLWHIDGYDKLKPFGFAIHGCIDGFSRKILWLEVARSNNNPRIIAFYYLKTVQRLNFLPTLIRSDLGTENCMVESLHTALRLDHNDRFSGHNSFMKGRSTSNQRIEAYWSQMRKHGGDFYISLFKGLRDEGIYDDANPIAVECLCYCFGPLIRKDLNLIQDEWNRHRIRRQKQAELPVGKPNCLFFTPQGYSGRHCHQELQLDVLEDLITEYTSAPVLVDELFCELVQLLKPDLVQPSSVEEALTLFVTILDLVKNYVVDDQ